METRKKFFENEKELVLATASRSAVPNANVVISMGFVDGKILIADCQMSTTIENLKHNSKVCIIGGYYRILGICEIYSSGTHFDHLVEALKNTPYKPKHALLVHIEKIFDLEKVQEIRLK